MLVKKLVRLLSCLQHSSTKDIVGYLLQEGADVNKKDTYGNTALHRAARTTNTEIIRMLVDKGADMESKNRLNKTPLDFCLKKENRLLLLELQQSSP